MWYEIFQVALTNGLWSALFVGLLVYQLKDSAKREKRYQETISKLNEHLDIVTDIKEEIKDLRNAVLIGKRGCKSNDKSK